MNCVTELRMWLSYRKRRIFSFFSFFFFNLATIRFSNTPKCRGGGSHRERCDLPKFQGEGARLIAGYATWNLWWTKWQWVIYLSYHFSIPLSAVILPVLQTRLSDIKGWYNSPHSNKGLEQGRSETCRRSGQATKLYT